MASISGPGVAAIADSARAQYIEPAFLCERICYYPAKRDDPHRDGSQYRHLLRFDPRLDPDRRYCRPWTRDFLEDLSQAYYKEFRNQIQVNSAVRTVKIQKKLRRHNRNAAPETGETASSHLAGVTVDIQRRGMSRQQIKWMQQYMLPLKNLGLIEPEEERRQWVFHVMVSDRYTDWRESRMLAGEPPEQAESEAMPGAAGGGNSQ